MLHRPPVHAVARALCSPSSRRTRRHPLPPVHMTVRASAAACASAAAGASAPASASAPACASAPASASAPARALCSSSSPDGLWLGSWFRFLTRMRLAPFVPTPNKVGIRLLSLAHLAPGETLVDLGSGDGRLLSLAVSHFEASRAIGYELDPELIRRSAEDAAALPPKLAERISVHRDDIWNAHEALREVGATSPPTSPLTCPRTSPLTCP